MYRVTVWCNGEIDTITDFKYLEGYDGAKEFVERTMFWSGREDCGQINYYRCKITEI